jgi:hypothetical protein
MEDAAQTPQLAQSGAVEAAPSDKRIYARIASNYSGSLRSENPQEVQTPPSLQLRAIELHEKAFMPWHDAEQLALKEVGIDDAAIDELIGECASAGVDSLLTEPDDLRQFTRAVLVHNPLAASQPQGVQPGYAVVPVEPAPPLTEAQERERFEAIFSKPPYEFEVGRFREESAWPGNYREYRTQCAWDAWLARAAVPSRSQE